MPTTVSIERRGNFNDDTFYKDCWEQWDKAMHEAIERWDKKTKAANARRAANIPVSERNSVYREIRSNNVTADESQAVSCIEEDERFRIVMDCKDFNPEDMNIKAMDEKIFFDGTIEKKEGRTITRAKFSRKFLMPPGVDMSNITSALSQDGILTIFAPKLQ